MRPLLRTASLLFVSLVAACGGSAQVPDDSRVAVENPTGSCTAPDSGSRAGYHSAAGSVWLPDCQSPLKREYWRVFAINQTSSYVVPRPDGASQLATPCADPQHELYPVVTKYALCQSADASSIHKVNDIQPVDALAVTHFLHTQLKFEPANQTLAPYPIPTDIVAACQLHPEANTPAFQKLCQREQDRLDSGQDIGFSYELPEAAELAQRLNELYGIPQ